MISPPGRNSRRGSVTSRSTVSWMRLIENMLFERQQTLLPTSLSPNRLLHPAIPPHINARHTIPHITEHSPHLWKHRNNPLPTPRPAHPVHPTPTSTSHLTHSA